MRIRDVILLALVTVLQLVPLAGRVRADVAGASERGPTDRLLRPRLPLPPAPFWRHALLTPRPDQLREVSAKLAADAQLRGDRSAEAQLRLTAAEARLYPAAEADAALRDAWLLAERCGDLPSAAEAHFLLAYRAYLGGDPLVAETHAATAQALWQQQNLPESALRALALQALIRSPQARQEPLLVSDPLGMYTDLMQRQLLEWASTFGGGGRQQEPLADRLVSAKAGALLRGKGIGDQASHWCRLLDGYQYYVEVERESAQQTWQSVAHAEAAEPTVRGLAFLALAWLQMELATQAADASVVAKANEALTQARALFKRSALISGMAATHLLGAECNYLAGRADEARSDVAEASRLYGTIQRNEAVVQTHLLSFLGEVRQKDGKKAAAAITTAVDAAEGQLLRLRRVSPQVVSRLASQAKTLPILTGKTDARSPEETLAEARGFLAWARESGEPIAELLALSALNKVLSQAGYLEDAAYYGALQSHGYAAYVAALPLEGRLWRSALLDYDLLVADDTGDIGVAGFRADSFDKLKVAMKTILEASVQTISADAFAGITDLTKAELEQRVKQESELINEVLDQVRDAYKGYLDNYSRNRKQAVRHLLDMRRALDRMANLSQPGQASVNNNRLSLTSDLRNTDPPTQIKAHLVLRYVTFLPDRSAADRLHESAFRGYTFDLLAAAHLAEEKRAVNAAAELASFYSLYRDALKPPIGVDFPTRLGDGLAFDAAKALEHPETAAERAKLMKKGIEQHQQRYKSRLLSAYKKETDGPGLLAMDVQDLSFIQDNFTEKARVKRNDVAERIEGGKRLVEMNHEAEFRFEPKKGGPMLRPPTPNRDFDILVPLRHLFAASTPLGTAPATNWSAIVDAVSNLDTLKMYGNLLPGFSLSALLDNYSVFTTLLSPAALALSRSRIDDLTFPTGIPTFAEAAATLNKDPASVSVARSFGKIAAINQARIFTDPRYLLETFNSMLGSLGAKEGPQGVLSLLSGGFAHAAAYPELTFALLGDPAEGRAAYEQVLEQQKDVGAEAGADPATVFSLGFSVALHHMLENDWIGAARQLEALRLTTASNNLVQSYQLSYLESICLGRQGDTAGQRIALEKSAEALDRARAALHSRELAYKLGAPRQAVYENLLGLLHRQKDLTAMDSVLARYKRANATPVAAVRAAPPGTAQALAENRHAFHALTQLGPGSGAQGASTQLIQMAGRLVAPQAAATPPPRQAVMQALSRIAEILVNEASPPESARGALPAPGPEELRLSYFVGTRGTYLVTRNDKGELAAYYSQKSTAELARLTEDFRHRIEARQETGTESAALYDLLLAPVKDLPKASHLIIWPDGPLALVPFQALRRKPTGQYLIETHLVSYLSGGQQSAGKGAPAMGNELLLIGNPDGKLANAEDEVMEIASLPGQHAGMPLVRSDATLEHLRQRLPVARLVHFATHGNFLDDYPNFSYLQLARGDRLYSLDLGGLDFTGRDVFLSACETRLGKVLPGDDVYGVADAFLASGAQTVVATLWRIESKASAAFAKGYYRELSDSKGSAEALARMARDFVQKRTWVTNNGIPVMLDHPYYWSGYGVIRNRNPETH